MTIFGSFNELLATQNENLARFARIVECDFFCDFQTLFLCLGYRVLLGVIPRETERIRQMMVDLGLDPDDNREDYQTAVGIGNLCGNNVVKDRLDDGVNQLGNRPGITYNRNPYSDYTSYKSVNTAQELVDPSRWQPAIETDGKGKFTSQIFVTPHNGLTRPYLIKDVNQYEVGPHGR